MSLLSPILAQMAPQPLPEVEHLQGSNYPFCWEGVPGRVYFIQTSSSLTGNEFNWEFAPDIRVGTGDQIEMGFQARKDHFEFFRLVYSDYNGEMSPDLADFDNDGYTNLEEASANTNPYDAQYTPEIAGNTGDSNFGGTVWKHNWEYTLTYKVEEQTVREDVITPYEDVEEYGYDIQSGVHTELIFNSNDDDLSVSFLRFEVDKSSYEWEFKGVVELSNDSPLWDHDEEPYGSLPDGRLIPFAVEVRKPSEGKWVNTQELKIAKWEGAWVGGTFRDEFIDTYIGEEIDRFRIRVDTQDLPDEFTKIFISTSGGFSNDYNDNSTEVSLEIGVHPNAPSEGFISKAMIMTSDSVDNKFNNKNLLNDQTHVASLGSNVIFRIKKSDGDVIITKPVNKRKTVSVNVKLLNHGPNAPLGSVDKISTQMNVAREIFSQSGLEVKYDFSIVDIDQEIEYPFLNVFDKVDLTDFFTLNDENTPGSLHTEAKFVLSQLATPNDTTDVVCLFVPELIHYAANGIDKKPAWGYAISDNDEIIPFFPSSDPNLYWEKEVSDLYKGTLLVSLQTGNPSTLAHELGHVLTLNHIDQVFDEIDENRNHGSSAKRNFMKNPSFYTYDHESDFKRMAPFQQIRVLKSQFVSDPEPEPEE